MRRILVTREDEARRVWTHLKGRRFAADTETTGLHYWRDRVIGMSFCDGNESWYFPFLHEQGRNLPLELLTQIASELGECSIIGANWTFDSLMLMRHGYCTIERARQWDDATILAYTLNENRPHKIEELAKIYLGSNQGEEDEAIVLRKIAEKLVTLNGIKIKPNKNGKYKSELKAYLKILDARDVTNYACNDVIQTWDLFHHLEPRVRADNTWHIYESFKETQIDLEVIKRNGLVIDLEQLEIESANAVAKSDELRDRVRLEAKDAIESGSLEWSYDEYGDPLELNLGSPKQLQKIFGDFSTAKSVLTGLAEMGDPFAKLVLEWRQWQKVEKTYYRGIRKMLDGNILHPNISLTGAVVRFSGSNPNMQAIPRGSDIYKVKETVIAPPGKVFIEADYSQAEVIMNYHYSADPGLYDILYNGTSMHDKVAKEIGCTKQEAKPINFAGQYGVGAKKFVKAFGHLFPGLTQAEAQRRLEVYFRTFPRSRMLYRQAAVRAEKKGETVLWSGRKRRYKRDDEWLASTHTASNNLIQGGVSEIVRESMTRIRKEIPELDLCLTVHDSIDGYADADKADEVVDKMRVIMEDFPWLRMPIKIDAHYADRWSKLK